jgi:NADH-quinone oxidoreductase subunit E
MPAVNARTLLSLSDQAALAACLAKFADRRSAILPGLHIAYDRFGYVNLELYQEIAEVLGVPMVWVAEAASFYTFFPKKPVGRFHIKVCDNLSCALRGACDMVRHLESQHGIQKGRVTPDGLFSLVTEECLAACCDAPMLQLNDTYHHNLTPERLDQLIEGCRREAKESAEVERARA